MDKLQWKKYWREQRLDRKEEIWKTLDLYTGIEASDFGNIKRNGILSKKYITPLGYELVYLGMKGGKPLNKTVHRLVAIAFLGDRKSEGLEVNHIDGIKTNNRLENLEYVTKSDNQKHSFRMGLNNANRHSSYYDSIRKKISQYSSDGLYITTYSSITKASEVTGVWNGGISRCLHGKQKTSGGYIWKF